MSCLQCNIPTCPVVNRDQCPISFIWENKDKLQAMIDKAELVEEAEQLMGVK